MDKMWSRHGSYEYDNYITTRFGRRKDLLNTIQLTETPHRKMMSGKIIFLASATHSWLPLNDTLQRRGKILTPRCPVCGKEGENMEHFMFCDRYRPIWKRGKKRSS